MLIGYMRVSTDNDRQVLDLQRDALLAAGVDERHLVRRSRQRQPRRSCRPCKGSGLPQTGRLSRGVETRPSRAIIAPPARDSEQPEGTRGGVPLADRADGYHHPSWRIPVPCLRSTGAIRAVVDPGAGESGSCRRATPGPARRSPGRDQRRKDDGGCCGARGRRDKSRGLPHLRDQAQHADRLPDPHRLVCRCEASGEPERCADSN